MSKKTDGMTEAPLILAVETSGRTGSVALAMGKKMLAETAFCGLMRHSAEVFPSIYGLLQCLNKKADEIGHVYISIGPGSFTGLRIAVALAKTMHLANSARIVAVNTMDVIAANAADYADEGGVNIDRIATILDAKRSQFFTAIYQRTSDESNNAQFEKILPDCLMTAAQFIDRFADQANPIWLLGEGLSHHKDAFNAESIHLLPENYWSPRAAKVHLLGWQRAQAGKFADALTLQPTYLRRPEAEEKWKPRSQRNRHH